MEKQKSSPGIVIAFFALILLSLPGAYVTGYFWAGDNVNVTSYGDGNTSWMRSYDYEWEKLLFCPAGKIEELLTGRSVLIVTKIQGGVI